MKRYNWNNQIGGELVDCSVVEGEADEGDGAEKIIYKGKK